MRPNRSLVRCITGAIYSHLRLTLIQELNSIADMCLGIPGKIIEIKTGEGLGSRARVLFGSVEKDIELSFVPHAKVGDFVIVHVGFAISVLEKDRAEQTLSDINAVLSGDPTLPANPNR